MSGAAWTELHRAAIDTCRARCREETRKRDEAVERLTEQRDEAERTANNYNSTVWRRSAEYERITEYRKRTHNAEARVAKLEAALRSHVCVAPCAYCAALAPEEPS